MPPPSRCTNSTPSSPCNSSVFRYFACVWNASSPLQCQAALRAFERLQTLSAQWHRIFEVPGCTAFCADEQPRSLRCHLLPDHAGVILGSLFERASDLTDDGAQRRAQLDSTNTRALLQTKGAHLIERYWGNYVALLHEHGHITALASPMGLLPCHASTVDGITWLYACLADALHAGLPPPRPTHIYVRNAILGRQPDADNPLDAVMRLGRGESLELRPSAHPPVIKRACLWDPHRFTTAAARIDSPELAARAIRNTVRACTHTLAGDYDHIHLRLSGGLDSSIIAGCLRGASARITAHTFLHAGTRADPRPWAHLAARHSGFSLSEHVIDPGALSLPTTACLRASSDVVSRSDTLFLPSLERGLCQTRSAHSPAAIMTGNGGDAGFCSDCTALALVQHLSHRGLTWHTWVLARQIALDTHRSLWHVLKRALATWRRRYPWIEPEHSNRPPLSLLNADLLHTPSTPLRHPWIREGPEAALTFFRLGLLTLPIEEPDLTVRTHEFTAEIVHPLLAQPVIELLLRIPVYRHFEGGRDRGLARRAFAHDASPANLERTWKDRAPGFLAEIFVQNTVWLREMLLDGALVNARYLDRQKLDRALTPAPSHSAVTPVDLMRMLDIELWMRQWR